MNGMLLMYDQCKVMFSLPLPQQINLIMLKAVAKIRLQKKNWFFFYGEENQMNLYLFTKLLILLAICILMRRSAINFVFVAGKQFYPKLIRINKEKLFFHINFLN